MQSENNQIKHKNEEPEKFVKQKSKAQISKVLTEEELKEMKEIFDLVDKDGGGTISKDELQQLMETLGLKPTEDQIESMMSEIDANNSGDIDFREFVTVMSKKIETNYTAEELAAAFKLFECRDAPGFIKTDVLQKAFTTYGKNKLSLDEAAKFVHILDPENKGKFNYKDFIKIVMTNTTD